MQGWHINLWSIPCFLGFPGGSAGKESTCNGGDLGSNPGLGRSPGEGKRLPTPVLWPGEFHGLYHPWGCKELDVTERLFFLNSCCMLCDTRSSSWDIFCVENVPASNRSPWKDSYPSTGSNPTTCPWAFSLAIHWWELWWGTALLGNLSIN